MRRLPIGLAFAATALALTPARSQDSAARARDQRDSTSLALPRGEVDVRPRAGDDEIRERIQSVLVATTWFEAPRVQVRSGVVFLDGTATSEALKRWAGDLARNTQDVVAVVNRLEVPKPSPWDFGPASQGLSTLWRDVLRWLPSLAFGALILGVSALVAVGVTTGVRALLRRRLRVALLRRVVAWAAGVLVFLLGVYVILRLMGLTQLALTVVGGTGLIGLAIGIAFRNITENFLASIFLSMQRPFETGDLVDIGGETGYVQQLNMRTTILMNLDGNVVQIPNAAVYKGTLRNYTANANRREVFDVGIGYDDPIDGAQEIARQVLAEHPAVLDDPAPAVLVDSLGASTVNLRVYFWLDGKRNSWLRVRSSVIRLVKREFQARGISMPDAARELLFPQGVPVTIVDQPSATGAAGAAGARPAASGAGASAEVATRAEGSLQSEAGVIESQARQAQPSMPGENLLSSAGGAGPGASETS